VGDHPVADQLEVFGQTQTGATPTPIALVFAANAIQAAALGTVATDVLHRHARLTSQIADGCQTAKPIRVSARNVTLLLMKSSWSASDVLKFSPSRTYTVVARPQSATIALV
jgi:hypothetical protein